MEERTHRIYSTLFVNIIPLFALIIPPGLAAPPPPPPPLRLGTISGKSCATSIALPSSLNNPPQISSGAGGELAACAELLAFGVAPSKRQSGMRVASSVIFSLMLSLRRLSTALCDSRRRLRFSFAIRALRCRVPAMYVRHGGVRVEGGAERSRACDASRAKLMSRCAGRTRKQDTKNALFRRDVVGRGLPALLHAHDAHAGHVDLLRTDTEPDAAQAGTAVERAEAWETRI